LTSPTSEKTALVTGSGSGIGRAAALGLLDDGWRVVLAGRRPEPLQALALDGRAFNIVATQVDIGNALTELSERMTRGVLQANGTTAPEPMMDARHVADAVRHIAAMPLEANVLNLTVMASAMPFVGRGRNARLSTRGRIRANDCPTRSHASRQRSNPVTERRPSCN
jgi:NADP-dependent 3-hydroxy acid dehydrogenase YdfG